MPHLRELHASRLNLAVLAKAVESARQAEGLSLRQVATELGITPSTLTRIRQGKRPDAEALAVLATWADVPVRELLSPDDPARRSPAPQPTRVDQRPTAATGNRLLHQSPK